MLNQAVMPIAMVALGFVSLTKGATWLVDGARALARRLGVSELLIGLTVVAFGTSLPEMTVNLFSAAQGSAGLALGNILGSNVCNILLILGVCALVRPVVFPRGVCRFELPVAAGVAPFLALLVLLSADSRVDALGGAVLLLAFALFLAGSFRRGVPEEGSAEGGMRVARAVFLVAIGLICLVAGGKVIVSGASSLARLAGLGEGAIGMTIVAVGTSLPELAASLAAVRRGSGDLAVGNVVGSNVFNVLMVLGLTALVEPVPVGKPEWAQILMASGAGFLLVLCLFAGPASGRRRLGRLSGALFLLAYAAVVRFSLV